MILTLHHLIRDCSIDWYSPRCWACEPRVLGFPVSLYGWRTKTSTCCWYWVTASCTKSLRCLNGSDVVIVLFDVASEAFEDHRLAVIQLSSLWALIYFLHLSAIYSLAETTGCFKNHHLLSSPIYHYLNTHCSNASIQDHYPYHLAPFPVCFICPLFSWWRLGEVCGGNTCQRSLWLPTMPRAACQNH